MAHRIVEQMVMFPFEFISPTEITIEESASGVAMVTGTLLREGVSRNGNLYTVSEMENIANQAEGMPIYVGTTTKVDPNYGIKRDNTHANFEENRVGRIIRTVFNKVKRIIKFWAELVNTKSHPKIIEEVKQGWGISIGGIATKAKVVMDEVGRLLIKVLGMKLKHVQLLAPHIARGQVEAQVDGVEIQESMVFYDLPKQTMEVNKIDLGHGIKNVDITYS